MGWTFSGRRETKKDFIEERLSNLSRYYRILDKKVTANAIYFMAEHLDTDKRFIGIDKIECDNGEWGYNDQCESMGSYDCFDCPVKWFDMVEAPNDYAKQWREKCLNHQGKKAKVKTPVMQQLSMFEG